METTEYRLKSDPKKSALVPADYASRAGELVRLAMENPARLSHAVSEHPYLGRPGILAATSSLTRTRAGTPESLNLQDEVYLRVCIYGVEEKMRGPERDEVKGLDRVLMQMVEDL